MISDDITKARKNGPARPRRQRDPEVLSGDLSRIGCVAVNADEPALFDMPAAEQPAMSQPRQRGRNRETWARTVTAEITIVDEAALRQAARRVQESAVTITLPALPHEEDPVAEDPAVEDAEHAFDVLAWLLWPTDSLEAPLEAGAFRILSEDIEVEPESDDRGMLAWTVTVKLTDVRALRRLAAQAHPDEAAIEDSLALAWEYAADPFAPLHEIPAIAWRPGSVAVQHVPEKSRPGTPSRA
jgi:hypothetical protein